MKKVLSLICLAFVCGTAQCQLKQKQCRVDSIISQARNKIKMRAITMNNDTITVLYDRRYNRQRLPVNVGTWLTIEYYEKKIQGNSVRSRIKVNN